MSFLRIRNSDLRTFPSQNCSGTTYVSEHISLVFFILHPKIPQGKGEGVKYLLGVMTWFLTRISEPKLTKWLNNLLTKWNEMNWAYGPPLCTYRLKWARRTSWGWWDDWHDTVLQTQDSKFEPWRSEGEHATSRSRRLPTILSHVDGEETILFFFKPPRPGTELWRERQRC